MGMVPLNLETINQIRGGALAAAIEKALNRVAVDCESAPDISAARTVTIKVAAKPVATVDNGLVELDDVIVEFSVVHRTPERVCSARMRVQSATNGARQLAFQLDAPDNPDQNTMFGEE